MNEPIAIIGSSCRFPGESSTPEKLWELNQRPRDLLRKFPKKPRQADNSDDQEQLLYGTGNIAGSYFISEDVRGFDHHFFRMHPMEASTMDPQYRLTLECVYEALESAGLPMEKLRGSSTAVFAGLTGTDYSNILTRDPLEVPRYTATGAYKSMFANRISYFFDLSGPSITVDTACSSSLVALHQAVQSLRCRDADMAIVCGANLLLDSGKRDFCLLSPDPMMKCPDISTQSNTSRRAILACCLPLADVTCGIRKQMGMPEAKGLE